MKRFQPTNGISFPVLLALASPLILQACGGAETSRNDGGRDGSQPGLDASAVDGAVDHSSVPPRDVAAPLDTARVDLQVAPEAGLPLVDGGADQAVPPGPDASPDTSTQTDSPLPPAEVGGSRDLADLAVPDAPLGRDGPAVDGARSDGADVPQLSDALDAPAIDVQTVDSAPIEANLPGALTGWPTETLDFGPNPCGGEAPAAKTFTLTNGGWSPVTLVRASFTGATGYTTDAEGKTIAAGGTLVVAVQAPAVPQTVNIPATYDAILTIQTDIPGDDQHLVQVTESAQGAILTWDTVQDFGSFGALSPGHTTSASFHVINMGNVAAEVALATTGQFAVTSATPVTIAARSASDSVVAFVPSIGGTALGTLAMSLATPAATCQPIPGPLSLTGTSINGAIALSAVSLSFASECNLPTTPQTLTVTNTGTVAMTWTASLEAGAGSTFGLSSTTSTLTPESGSPEPSIDVSVTSAIPTSATPITDVINIVTDAVGDTAHTVVLTQTPLGDVVSVPGEGTIELGSVPIVSPALTSPPVTVTLRNDANTNSTPAQVTLQMTGPNAAYFSVTPTEVSIPAGGQVDVSVTFSPGTNPALVTSGNHIDLSATLAWAVGAEANCGQSSGEVLANATATLGQVSGIPGQLDFLEVDCGKTALKQQITVTNSGAASYQVTDIVLANSTYYAVEHPELPKALTAGGSMVITVTPSAIPETLGAVPDHARFDGRLTITTDLLGDVPHEVALLMGARGAIITNSPWPTDWNFGTAPFPGSRKLYIPVINAGNVPVSAALQDVIVAPAQAGVFYLESPSTLAANQTSNIVAMFLPNEAGSTFTATANLMLSPVDSVFCQPLPSGWNETTHNIHMQGQSSSAP